MLRELASGIYEIRRRLVRCGWVRRLESGKFVASYTETGERAYGDNAREALGRLDAILDERGAFNEDEAPSPIKASLRPKPSQQPTPRPRIPVMWDDLIIDRSPIKSVAIQPRERKSHGSREVEIESPKKQQEKE